MPRRLTISSLELAESCLYWARPDVELPPSTDAGEAASVGKETHTAIQAAIMGQPIPELSPQAAAYYETWAAAYTLADFPAAVCEEAYAFDGKTVRVLGYNIDRKYAEHGATDEDICGSADIVYVRDGVLHVADIKTGGQYNLTRFGNPQVRAYAAMAASVRGLTSARAVIIVVNDEGCKEYVDDVLDVTSVLSHITSLDTEATMFEPGPMPGDHCKTKWCKLAATCPALNKASTELMKPAPLLLATKEDVANTIQKLTALEAQAAAIWKLVDAKVEEMGDIELPNGKLYGWNETSRESIELTPPVARTLEEKFPGIVKVSLTKSDLDRRVKEVAPRGQAAKMARAVLDELRESGCVKVNVSKSLGIK